MLLVLAPVIGTIQGGNFNSSTHFFSTLFFCHLSLNAMTGITIMYLFLF